MMNLSEPVTEPVTNGEKEPFDRQRAFREPEYFIEKLLHVNTKEEGIKPFRLNSFQKYYMNWRKPKPGKRMSGRRVIVKSRQITCSTIIKAKNIHKAITTPATKVLTITHHDEATKLFRLVVRQWCDQLENLGFLPPVEKDGEDILSFKGLNSAMVFTTAGGKLGGRAATYNTIHLSEIAHWTKDPGPIVGGILPSVPKAPYGEVDIESSPNGAAGPLYDIYWDAKRGDNDWDYTFWEWWKQEEYRLPVPRGFKLTPDEQKLIQRVRWEDGNGQIRGLDLEQIVWRRWMKQEMKRTAASGTMDGRGLFPQEYPEDDISCFMAGTDLVFDAEAIEDYISMIQPPLGSSESWNIWEYYQPGEPYVLVADPSKGKSDWGAAHVIALTGGLRVVARLHQRVIPSRFTEMLYMGALMYGMPYIVVETPGVGESVLERLVLKYNYPNLYYHSNDMTGKVNTEPGWPQNTHTRSQVISELQHVVDARGIKVPDERTVAEFGSLTWHRTGQLKRIDRAEAAVGTHDDLVLALGIGLAVRDDILRMHNKKFNIGGGKRAIRLDTGYMMGQSGSPYVSGDAEGVTGRKAVGFGW